MDGGAKARGEKSMSHACIATHIYKSGRANGRDFAMRVLRQSERCFPSCLSSCVLRLCHRPCVFTGFTSGVPSQSESSPQRACCSCAVYLEGGGLSHIHLCLPGFTLGVFSQSERCFRACFHVVPTSQLASPRRLSCFNFLCSYFGISVRDN